MRLRAITGQSVAAHLTKRSAFYRGSAQAVEPQLKFHSVWAKDHRYGIAGTTIMNLVPDCDVLLVVATETERDACLTLFSELLGASHSLLPGLRRTYFDLGIVEGAKVCMVQCEMGSGAPGAAQSTVADAVDDLRPGSVIMVGISFGIDPKKQRIGQVLVSKQLKPYEVQRVGTDKSGQPEIVSRGDKVTASTTLLSRVRSSSVDWEDGKVSFGLLLSGEKLIDNVDFRNAIAQFELEAIGGEMEGAGLYASCADRNTSEK